MEFKDYYKILGVNEKTEVAEIKKSYRKLARQYHPDVSKEKDCEDKFKEINEAYEVLGDPEKRAEYDQLRSMGAMGTDGRFKPPPDWESAAHFSEGGFTEADMAGFSDFFESVFGRSGTAHRQYGRTGRQQQMRMRGDDLHFKLALFLEELHHGCDKVIEYQVPNIDEYGLLNHEPRKIKVKIPAGSSTEKPIRLKGQGGKGIGGGANGDLYLDLEVAPHPVYSVKGNNLYRKLAITPWEAVLGSSVKMQTLANEVQLTIPPNSQSGQQLKLKGKGLNGGDLYVELDIVVPGSSTDKAKELYRELQKESGFNPRQGASR